MKNSNDFLIPEGDLPVEAVRDKLRGVKHVFDSSFPRRWRYAPRPEGFLLMPGIHLMEDQTGTVRPLEKNGLHAGLCARNERGGVLMFTHCRIWVTLPEAWPRDRGKPVYAGGPTGPYSLDPLSGPRVGFLVFVSDEKVLIQVIPGEAPNADIEIGGFEAIEPQRPTPRPG